MAIYEQVADGNPDGSIFGASTTEKIAFFGVTPIVQPAATSPTSTSLSIAPVTITGVFGFSTQTAFSNALTLLNKLYAAVVNLGLGAA